MEFLPVIPVRGHITASDTPTLARAPKVREEYGGAVFFANPATVERRPSVEAGVAKMARPFSRASFEHVEPAFDVSQLMGANAVQLGPFDVPAFGFMRHVWLLVEGSGGTLGAGVLDEDSPYIALASVSLLDVNGGPIVGPVDGYDLAQINKHGGYAFSANPASIPDFSNTVNPVFALRIPVEISHRTGHGSLANMNAAASYKVSITLNNTGGLFSTAPTTPPTVRIRGYLEAWALPQPLTRNGRAQRAKPPAHGTTQYWSKFVKDTVSGENTIILPRVGNRIRTLIAILRTSAGARSSANYPDPIRLVKDSRQVLNEPKTYREAITLERYGYASDTGVYVYDFSRGNDPGHPGGEDDGHLWMRTRQSTRLELAGSFGAAGVLTLLTNDVAPPIGTDNRFEAESATGGPSPSAYDGE